jgi:hypothetical protein
MSLWEQALNAAVGFVKPVHAIKERPVKARPAAKGSMDSFKEPGEKAGPNDFKMAKILNQDEVNAQNARGLDRVFGDRWRKEIREGRNPQLPGPGGHLPRFDAKDGMTRGGFFNFPKDKGGNPIPGAPARSYATPATHEVAPRYGREEFLSSQYDFRKARGEKLPPWPEWLDIQTDSMRK